MNNKFYMWALESERAVLCYIILDAIKEHMMNGAYGDPVEQKSIKILLARKPKWKKPTW
jgi:hypothetical protein